MFSGHGKQRMWQHYRNPCYTYHTILLSPSEEAQGRKLAEQQIIVLWISLFGGPRRRFDSHNKIEFYHTPIQSSSLLIFRVCLLGIAYSTLPACIHMELFVVMQNGCIMLWSNGCCINWRTEQFDPGSSAQSRGLSCSSMAKARKILDCRWTQFCCTWISSLRLTLCHQQQEQWKGGEHDK